jgi:hypothetical protein
VASTFPSRVSERGTPEVLVLGEGFTRTVELACVFRDATGDRRVPARYVGERLLACPAPPHMPGHVEVLVSTNGHEVTDSRAVLDYTGTPLTTHPHANHMG